MGKDQAPPYANLTIAYLILNHLYPIIEKEKRIDAANHVKMNSYFS